jgi:hypothetical protein
MMKLRNAAIVVLALSVSGCCCLDLLCRTALGGAKQDTPPWEAASANAVDAPEAKPADLRY